jgi:hypothetical protein
VDRAPGDALDEVQRVPAPLTSPDLTIFCGRPLAAGMWACADLARAYVSKYAWDGTGRSAVIYASYSKPSGGNMTMRDFLSRSDIRVNPR